MTRPPPVSQASRRYATAPLILFGPRLFALSLAWALLLPTLSIWLDCYEDVVPGEAALAIIWFAPVVLHGAVAPVLLSTIGALSRSHEIEVRCWLAGAFLSLLADLFHALGRRIELCMSFIPILPAVLLSGLATLRRKEFADLLRGGPGIDGTPVDVDGVHGGRGCDGVACSFPDPLSGPETGQASGGQAGADSSHLREGCA